MGAIRNGMDYVLLHKDTISEEEGYFDLVPSGSITIGETVLSVLEDGRVLPTDHQDDLKKHQGKWRIQPCGADLLLVRDEGDAPCVPVSGDIGSIGGLADVIAFIHQNRWTGTLRAVQGDSVREVRFGDGDVETARSSLPSDRLGEILFRYGRLSRDEIVHALSVGGRRRIGQTLVELDLLTTHDVFTFIRKQVEEIFFSLLSMRSGSYWFVRRDPEDTGEPRSPLLSTQKLLFDGARMLDEMEYFRERIPSSRSIPIRRRAASKLVPLGEDARRVLSLVDGVRTVEDIGRESKLGEFEATRVIFQLLQAGHLELLRESNALHSSLTHEKHEGPSSVVDFFANLVEKVQETLSTFGNPLLLNTELKAFMQSSSDYSLLFDEIELDETGQISTDRMLDNLDSVPEEDRMQFLAQGLNEFLCFLLFVVGDKAGRQSQDEVNRSLTEDLPLVEEDEKETIDIVVGGEVKQATVAVGGELEARLAQLPGFHVPVRLDQRKVSTTKSGPYE